MAKKKGTAGGKSAKAKAAKSGGRDLGGDKLRQGDAKLKAANGAKKAQKARAAKDAAAVKAVLDAEAIEAADEAQAEKPKRGPGRVKGDTGGRAEVERQEKIAEALEYRKMGYTYRQIGETMDCAPSTAHKWVAEGLAAIPMEPAEDVRRMMLEQLDAIMQKLMPQLDDTAPKDIIENIMKVQAQQMKLHGLGGGGISIHLPGAKADGNGNSTEDTIIRIRADAPTLKPDEPIPANPVL